MTQIIGLKLTVQNDLKSLEVLESKFLSKLWNFHLVHLITGKNITFDNKNKLISSNDATTIVT